MGYLVGFWIGFVAVIASVLLAVFASPWWMALWVVSITANAIGGVRETANYYRHERR